MALSIGSTARVLSAQQAYSITSRNDKSAEDDAYSSVRNVAKTGGDLFTRDIDAVLDEVAKVESGESGDRKQLAKLLNETRAAFSARSRSRNRVASPGLFSCRPRATARSPAGTSRVMTDPDPVIAPSPSVTGATSIVSEPTKTSSPIVVRCLFSPS